MENVKITKETVAVAEKLPRLMKEKGYTQQELASKLGISDSMLGSIINKKRNISAEIVTKLALILGKTTDQLLGLVAESETELAELKHKRALLEKNAAELLARASKLSTGERASIMENIAAIDREIAVLDAKIGRSEQVLARHEDTGVSYPIAEARGLRLT